MWDDIDEVDFIYRLLFNVVPNGTLDHFIYGFSTNMLCLRNFVNHLLMKWFSNNKAHDRIHALAAEFSKSILQLLTHLTQVKKY